MGRVIKTIEIEGQPAVALFDTGATFTYVHEKLLEKTQPLRLPRPFRVALGGRSIEVSEMRFIGGSIEGLDFNTTAVPVAQLGKADGHQLDAIIGALTMEQWEIRVDPKSGALDLEGLRRREFTEY